MLKATVIAWAMRFLFDLCSDRSIQEDMTKQSGMSKAHRGEYHSKF